MSFAKNAIKNYLDAEENEKKRSLEEKNKILKKALKHALKVELAHLEDVKDEIGGVAEDKWDNPIYSNMRKRVEASADYAACMVNIDLYKKALSYVG